MGCDSHVSIEIRGRWDHRATAWTTFALDIPQDRDYDLFTAMADVRRQRDDIETVALPRGCPVDASDTVKYWIKRADGDGHTHSWLSASEFRLALDRAETDYKPWVAIDKILYALESVYGKDNARIVFFFDN